MLYLQTISMEYGASGNLVWDSDHFTWIHSLWNFWENVLFCTTHLPLKNFTIIVFVGQISICQDSMLVAFMTMGINTGTCKRWNGITMQNAMFPLICYKPHLAEWFVDTFHKGCWYISCSSDTIRCRGVVRTHAQFLQV